MNNIECINQYFYFIKEYMTTQNTWWVNLLLPAILSGLVLYFVNYLNRETQKQQALYQKQFEFWLEFGQSFFKMQSAISFLLREGNFDFGIIYYASKEEILNNLKKLVSQWNKFYEMVDGNQKIYLEPKNINVLPLQAFISALNSMIKDDSLSIKEDGKFLILESSSIKAIVTEARSIFENNLKYLGNPKLEDDYIDKLINYSEEYKKGPTIEIDTSLSYEQRVQIKDKILKEISNEAFLMVISNNFKDTTDKILKITCPQSFETLFYKKVLLWFWKNIMQKIISIKNENSHIVITILWIKIKIKRRGNK